jgi:hypothetical protein
MLYLQITLGQLNIEQFFNAPFELLWRQQIADEARC